MDIPLQKCLNCRKLDQVKEIGTNNQNSINELIKMVRGLP